MRFLSQLKKIFTDQRDFNSLQTNDPIEQFFIDQRNFNSLQTNDSMAMSLPRQQENTMITAKQATELAKNSERYIRQLRELKIEEHIKNAANCGKNHCSVVLFTSDSIESINSRIDEFQKMIDYLGSLGYTVKIDQQVDSCYSHLVVNINLNIYWSKL